MNNEQERQRIGQRIADLRKHVEWTDELGISRTGMTQRQLGVRCGLQDSHIARIEKGRYSVGFDTLQTIAEALGGKIDIIINNKSEEL
jgi:transcriptional regulator with XRE-family HTH domain